MAAVKGNNMLLKIGDGASSETFTTIAGIRNKSVAINNNPIDVTTDDDVSSGVTFRSYITGVNEIDLSFDGIVTSVTG